MCFVGLGIFTEKNITIQFKYMHVHIYIIMLFYIINKALAIKQPYIWCKFEHKFYQSFINIPI